MRLHREQRTDVEGGSMIWPIAIVIGKLVWAGCVATLVVGWWDLAVEQGR